MIVTVNRKFINNVLTKLSKEQPCFTAGLVLQQRFAADSKKTIYEPQYQKKI